MTVTALMEIKIVTVWTFYYKTIIIVLHTPVTADSGWSLTGLVNSPILLRVESSSILQSCKLVQKTPLRGPHEPSKSLPCVAWRTNWGHLKNYAAEYIHMCVQRKLEDDCLLSPCLASKTALRNTNTSSILKL